MKTTRKVNKKSFFLLFGLFLALINEASLISCPPAGKQPKTQAPVGTEPTLHTAAGNGDVEAVRRELTGVNAVTARDPHGATVLHKVIRSLTMQQVIDGTNQAACLSLLLDWSMKHMSKEQREEFVNIPDGWGRPLIYSLTFYLRSSLHSFNLSIQGLYEQLIRAGAHVNARDRGSKTVLHFATEEGLFEVVRVLLYKGANPNLQDINGNTALHLVQDPRVLRALLSCHWRETQEIQSVCALFHLLGAQDPQPVPPPIPPMVGYGLGSFNINLVNQAGETPLDSAFKRCRGHNPVAQECLAILRHFVSARHLMLLRRETFLALRGPIHPPQV